MPTFYAQTIFAKPLEQITEADLTSYFQQERDETLNLEFKSYTDKPGDQRGQAAKDAEKVKGVLKTISAFLNSSGGLVIWGAPESVEVKRGEKKVKMCRGPLAPVPKFIDRDDFINKIAGQISPVPAGVRMQPVQVAGGYVYLFDVPESHNKPHQNDGRYYVRMDTRTDAAPHYLVYALCHQIKTPTLELKLEAVPISTVKFEGLYYTVIQLTATTYNKTPFIHESDVYTFWDSKKVLLSNTNDITKAQYSLQNLKVAPLLPLGIRINQVRYAFIPADTDGTEYQLRLTYGGRSSLATIAAYNLIPDRDGIRVVTRLELIYQTQLSDPSTFIGWN